MKINFRFGWAVALCVGLIFVAIKAFAENAPVVDAPLETPQIVSPLFVQIMSVIMAVVVAARLIVKLTPTPADDAFLQKVIDWLKHIGLNVKSILLMFALGLSLGVTGCVGTAAQKSLNGLKGDKASVVLHLRSIYFTGDIIRIGDTTNRLTFLPDGTIKVNLP